MRYWAGVQGIEARKRFSNTTPNDFFEEEKTMKLQEIKNIAKRKGVNPARIKKDELIKAIQRAEGNNDCFGTAFAAECGQINCLWRKDCVKNQEQGGKP